MREGKCHKRITWQWFPEEGVSDAGRTWHTQNREQARCTAARSKKGREKGRDGGREEDSNLRGLIPKGKLRRKAINQGFLEKEGLILSRERTGGVRRGRSGHIHCTEQAQSLASELDEKERLSLHVPAPCPWNTPPTDCLSGPLSICAVVSMPHVRHGCCSKWIITSDLIARISTPSLPPTWGPWSFSHTGQKAAFLKGLLPKSPQFMWVASI